MKKDTCSSNLQKTLKLLDTWGMKKKLIDRIFDYLEARCGTGMNFIKIDGWYSKTQKNICITCVDVPRAEIGVFRLMIDTCTPCVWIYIKDSGEFIVQPALQWKDHKGGKYGCDLNFRLRGDLSVSDPTFAEVPKL